MKNLPETIKNTTTTALIVLLTLYIVGMQFFPDQTERIAGFRLYAILTESMDPAIPPGSVVLSKVTGPDEVIAPNTIITFKVDDLGRDEIFTHYLRKIRRDETGRERYYTQGAAADRYDDYKTYREDILGTYVFHIPYVGKLILFLKSRIALVEMGFLFVLWIVYRILWEQMDAEEHLLRRGVGASFHLRLKRVSFDKKKGKLRVSGVLHNPSEKSLKEFYLYVVFLDKNRKILAKTVYEVEKLSSGGQLQWKLELPEQKNVRDYAVVIQKPGYIAKQAQRKERLSV